MERITYALDNLYIKYNIPVRMVSGNLELTFFRGNGKNEAVEELERMSGLSAKRGYPLIEETPRGMVVFFTDPERNLYIFGPSACPLSSILRCSILAIFLTTGNVYSDYELVQLNKQIHDKDDVLEKELTDYHLDISENEILRSSYRSEEQLMEAVSEGNTERIEQFFRERSFDNLGRMAKNDLKQLEYLAVSSITLSTRAAIRGGLDPYAAYELSDMYLQRLETCRGTSDIMNLNMIAMKGFAERVRAENKDSANSFCVEKCREYISHSINRNISVSEMADSIGYNRTYLARKFREEMGMTIQQYIMNEKVKAAEKLLRYSEFSISAISDFLGFYSQSHMGKHLKRVTGLSPSGYRKKYKIVDFMS